MATLPLGPETRGLWGLGASLLKAGGFTTLTSVPSTEVGISTVSLEV